MHARRGRTFDLKAFHSSLTPIKIRNALESRAVTFKLVEGSLEAGFLSVFCLIESSPQLIVIKYDHLLLFFIKSHSLNYL